MGRKMDFVRYEFDRTGASLARRLHRCFDNAERSSHDVFKDITDILHNELYYLACWNHDLFSELTSVETEGLKIYPPLFPGRHTSMFRVLEAEGMNINTMNFGKPGQCAVAISTILTYRVYARVPESRLLHEAPQASEPQPLPFVSKKVNETKKQYKKRKRDLAVEARDKFAALDYITLAFVPANLQHVLIREMEAVLGAKGKTIEDVKEVAESLMYRLATKEPRAFPEVFFHV